MHHGLPAGVVPPYGGTPFPLDTDPYHGQSHPGFGYEFNVPHYDHYAEHHAEHVYELPHNPFESAEEMDHRMRGPQPHHFSPHDDFFHAPMHHDHEEP